MKASKKTIALYIGGAVLLALIVVLALPLLTILRDPTLPAQLEAFVARAGFWGFLALLLLQMLQILIAFLPGELIEVAAGMMYGAIGGLLVCLLGIVLASAAIFTVVRKLGRARFVASPRFGKIKNIPLLHDARRLKSVVFVLYLIPGTPKDLLVYACALTELPRRDFLLISTLARIPSIVTSTMAGASFMEGNWVLTLVIFALIGAAGLWGISYQSKLSKREKRDR